MATWDYEEDSLEIDLSDEEFDTRKEWEYDPRGERYFDVDNPYYDMYSDEWESDEEEDEEDDADYLDDLGLGRIS